MTSHPLIRVTHPGQQGGRLFHDPKLSHSNCNDWIRRIHANDSKQSTQIDFFPVIEGDLNDINTIFTTLKECIRLTRLAIVTFDLLIVLQAVNIIKQANLPVIAGLAGFHLQKSYLESMGNMTQDSGLLDVIQLIFPGNTTASHIKDGGYFEKVIRVHLIDVAIYQHIMKFIFTEKERVDMKTFMEKVVTVFEQRFEEMIKRLVEGGRTPPLWLQYYLMVDVIKAFIRTERLADHNGHLSCIVTKILHIFAAAGQYHYEKAARMYCELVKELEILPAYIVTLERFTLHGKHLVRYSIPAWSGK